MKDIGLVGVPYSGKSTLFTALTHRGTIGGGAHLAVVPVPDPRLEVVAALAHSREVIPAQVRFLDVPGGTKSARGVAELRETNALCVVVRAFGPDQRPAEELAEVTSELLLADLAVVDSALQNARKRQKGQKGASEEVTVLARAYEALSGERLLRDVGFSDEEGKHLRPSAALTLKPWVVVANLEEGTGVPEGLPEETVGVYAEIEAETAEMPENEARALLQEFGVTKPGLEAVINACYRALDLITFFSANEHEAHAWQVRRGAGAPEAAGVIHTDMERGFIRAEVIGYEDLVAAEGWDKARHAGKVRVEGKDYVVQEGDVLHVRFAI